MDCFRGMCCFVQLERKLKKYFVRLKKCATFASHLRNDSVAQLVEQMTLNHWVESSSLSGVTRKGSSLCELPFLLCTSFLG